MLSAPIPFAGAEPVRLPCASSQVQAGFPSPADDFVEKSIDLNEELVSTPEATFFVRVRGESMQDAGIRDGDILVVDRAIRPKDNQIVVAMLDGDFTVKRFRNRGGQFCLEAENPAFASIPVGENQELVIWGVVTFIIHRAK